LIALQNGPYEWGKKEAPDWMALTKGSGKKKGSFAIMQKLPLIGLEKIALDRFFELFAGFELYNVGGLNLDDFTSLGISTLACFAAALLKGTEANQSHLAVFFLQSFGYAVDERFQGRLRSSFGDPGIFGHFLDDFCFGHLISSF
jgi:hypothetical protein